MSNEEHEEFSGFPEAPEEQQDEAQAEQSRINASVPVIQEVLDWFEKSIAEYGDTDKLNVTPDSNPITSIVSVCTTKGMKEQFKAKADDFRRDFARYLEEETD